jgi:hypothetical protein
MNITVFGDDFETGQLWDWNTEAPYHDMPNMTAVHYLYDRVRSEATVRVVMEPHMHQESVTQYMRDWYEYDERGYDQDKPKILAHYKLKNEVDWLTRWDVVRADGSLGEDPNGLVSSIPLFIQYHQDNLEEYKEDVQTAMAWYEEHGVHSHSQMQDDLFRQ